MEKQRVVDPGLAAVLDRFANLISEAGKHRQQEVALPLQEGRFDYCYRGEDDPDVVLECMNIANQRNTDPKD